MSKNRRFRFIGFVALIFTILSLWVVSAQDAPDDQPLLRMLARIPNSTLSRSEIYFNDRVAVEAAYPPAKMPKDWAEFTAMSEAKSQDAALLPVDIWWRVWRNQQSALTAQNMGYSKDSPTVVGFDYFQIEQEMTYGTPPAQTLQLAGKFNLDMVRLAFSSRGYTRQETVEAELWCPADGCANGMKTNLRDRNPANPFGGNLGRSQPLIIEDGTLISSSSEIVMQNHTDVAAGTDESLADLPQYRAAVDAITADGSLLQAYFLDGELLVQMSVFSPVPAMLGERATPELVKKYFQDMLKDYETLPMYQLLAFADAATDTEQAAEVALVYTSEADAKTAADVLPKRIAAYVSLVTKKPLTELLNDRKVTNPKIDIIESNGKYVVVIILATPKATVEQIQQLSITNPKTPEFTPPGLIYRMLVSAAMQRDLGWLNTVPREALEEAVK